MWEAPRKIGIFISSLTSQPKTTPEGANGLELREGPWHRSRVWNSAWPQQTVWLWTGDLTSLSSQLWIGVSVPLAGGRHDNGNKWQPHCGGSAALLVNDMCLLPPSKVCLCCLSKKKTYQKEKILPWYEKHCWLSVSSPTHEELQVVTPSCTTTTKAELTEESMTFLGPVRYLSFQDKLLLWTLERWVMPEAQLSRAYLEQKLLEPESVGIVKW